MSLVILFGGAIIYMLYPIYAYLHGERPYVIPILLPLIDFNSITGYHINLAYQSVLTIAVLFGIVAYDLFVIETISTYAMANNLLAYNCNCLTNIFNNNAGDTLDGKAVFRNVMVQLQDLNT